MCRMSVFGIDKRGTTIGMTIKSILSLAEQLKNEVPPTETHILSTV